MARVGRFQVMATLQAARARALGLSLDEAKSWGLNRAIFYAAAKRGFRRSRSSSYGRAGEHAAPAKKAHHGPMFELGGEEAYRAERVTDALRFEIGEEVQTPEEFDRQIMQRIPDWEGAWHAAQATVAAAERSDLESQHRFYERVYKPRRDELAKQWSGQESRQRTPSR